jgi:hypothetical protein
VLAAKLCDGLALSQQRLAARLGDDERTPGSLNIPGRRFKLAI